MYRYYPKSCVTLLINDLVMTQAIPLAPEYLAVAATFCITCLGVFEFPGACSLYL
jgi:hypothetical protein